MMERMGPWDLAWGHLDRHAWDLPIPRLCRTLQMAHVSFPSATDEQPPIACTWHKDHTWRHKTLKMMLVFLKICFHLPSPLPADQSLGWSFSRMTPRNYCFWLRRRKIIYQWLFKMQLHVSAATKETYLGMDFETTGTRRVEYKAG